jgi:replication fork clamp-binding protein CrfC
MTQFARDFVSSIEGTNVDISTKELSGGARIYYIFNDVFGHALASIDSTSNLGNHDIRTAIRNSKGPRPSLFIPETAFDLLVKPQIKLLESPSLRCVELVYEELVKICHNCTSNVTFVASTSTLSRLTTCPRNSNDSRLCTHSSLTSCLSSCAKDSGRRRTTRKV